VWGELRSPQSGFWRTPAGLEARPTKRPKSRGELGSPKSEAANLPTINLCTSYSCRSAASGSKLAARRDGIQQARNAMTPKNIGTTVKVTKSCALTPNK